jgi:bifunctional non-homologous end joining protein LigD
MKIKVEKITLEVTHEDKMLFPKSKISKKDLAQYYLQVATWMLPLMKHRPVSLHRFPQGIDKKGFFQKKTPERPPAWIKTTAVERKEKDKIEMILCNDAATLVWMANLACITPHIWLSRFDKPHYPDRLIFDLDPPEKGGFKQVVEGAFELKKLLEEQFSLSTFVNTTGSRGLHVVVPLKRDSTFDEVRRFAQGVTEELSKKQTTIEPRKEKRKGRLYLDLMRNAYAQTVVALYAVRAIEGAPVATPLFWEELKDPRLHSQSFNMDNIFQRLEKQQDPWASIEQKAKSLKKWLSQL